MGKGNDIIFLGRFFTPAVLREVMEDPKYNVGLSNHNFEMSLIGGLRKTLEDNNLRILTVPAVYSYPHNNSHIFTKSESYTDSGVETHSVSVLNLAVINKIYIFFVLLFNLIRYYGKCDSSEIGLIVNTPGWVNDSAVFLSRFFTAKKVRTVLIVPDLPEMMNTMFTDRVSLKQRIVGVLNRYGRWLADKYDCYVFLTEEMSIYFRTSGRYIVMEGLADSAWFEDPENIQQSAVPSILYTGSLARVFGIRNLVDAFLQMNNDDAELWICGAGDMSDCLAELASRNPRVRFFGMISADKARMMQRKATVLVNPRTSEGEYTKYSFPSKTMEYMAAGRPVVMNRLPGVPQEYLKYLIIPEDESVSALADTLDSVLARTSEELDSLGSEGRRFIKDNKNATMQVRRILDLLELNKDLKSRI